MIIVQNEIFCVLLIIYHTVLTGREQPPHTKKPSIARLLLLLLSYYLVFGKLDGALPPPSGRGFTLNYRYTLNEFFKKAQLTDIGFSLFILKSLWAIVLKHDKNYEWEIFSTTSSTLFTFLN